MENKNQIISSVSVVVVVIIIIWGFVYFNKVDDGGRVQIIDIATSTASVATSTTTSTGEVVKDKPLDIFAKCVASEGLTMYGAAWCGHCANEKKAFGDSFKYINYVECPDNIQLCTDKGINGYPTWIDGAGVKHEGEQGLSGLAKITGCELPK